VIPNTLVSLNPGGSKLTMVSSFFAETHAARAAALVAPDGHTIREIAVTLIADAPGGSLEAKVPSTLLKKPRCIGYRKHYATKPRRPWRTFEAKHPGPLGL
jgi:hypothetical protein